MRICEINFSADIVMKVFFLLLAKSLKKKVFQNRFLINKQGSSRLAFKKGF